MGAGSRGVAGLAPCGVRHVELDRGSQAIAPAPGERAVYAVFWHGGRPVGERVFMASELPVPASAVAALAADAVAAGLVQSDGLPVATGDGAAPPTVAVAICTRGRPKSLQRSLAALMRCDPAPADILVIDNAPRSDATHAAVAAHPGVRYVLEPRPGLSHARNRAVQASHCDVLAFTDDDVEVAPDWITRLAAPFANPEVTCVTGAVLARDLSGEGACLFEFGAGGLNNGFTVRRFDARFLRHEWWKSPPVWTIGAGANMAVRRSAFAAVGLFDLRLGAGAAGCSEDSELWFRLLRAGFVCVYDPASVVHHHHRQDRGALLRQMRVYMRGHVVALLVQFGQDRQVSHLLRPFVLLPAHFLRLLLRALGQGDRAALAMTGTQLLGCLEGLFDALRRLRQPGPPRLDQEGDLP